MSSSDTPSGMNPTTIAILAGALRTALSGVLGFVVARGWIPGALFNEILLGVAMLLICAWSVLQKRDTWQNLFPMITGVLRNLLTVALTYAAGRGWIGAGDAPDIVAAVGTLAAGLWSAEHKVQTTNG